MKTSFAKAGLLTFLLLLSIPLQTRASGGAWELDPRFGTEGKLVENLGGNKDVRIYASGISPDGKLVLAGSIKDKSTGAASCLLASYDLFGRIDASFGDAGKTINTDRCAAYHAITFQYGKIVATGISSEDAGTHLVLARHLLTGGLDPNFAGGRTAVNPTSFTGGKGLAIAVDSSGRLLIAAESGVPNSSFTKGVILRLFANGVPDHTFGNGGVTELSRMTRASAVELLDDGRMLVGGSYFSTDGTDDKGYLVVARVSDNGALDLNFGGKHGELDEGYSMHAVPGEATLTGLVSFSKFSDVKIVASGYFFDRNVNRNTAVLGRYDDQGELLGATWEQGKHLPLSGFMRPFTDFASSATEAHSLQSTNNGRHLIVAGVTKPAFGDSRTVRFTAVRYLVGFKDLLSDPFFDDGRSVRVKLGCPDCQESAHAAVVQSNEGFAVAGWTEETDGSSSIAVAAFGSFAALTAARRTANANPTSVEAVPFERTATVSQRPVERAQQTAIPVEPLPRESPSAPGGWTFATDRLPLFPNSSFLRWPHFRITDGIVEEPAQDATPPDDTLTPPESIPPAAEAFDGEEPEAVEAPQEAVERKAVAHTPISQENSAEETEAGVTAYSIQGGGCSLIAGQRLSEGTTGSLFGMVLIALAVLRKFMRMQN